MRYIRWLGVFIGLNFLRMASGLFTLSGWIAYTGEQIIDAFVEEV